MDVALSHDLANNTSTAVVATRGFGSTTAECERRWQERDVITATDEMLSRERHLSTSMDEARWH